MNLRLLKSVLACFVLSTMLVATSAEADEEPLKPWYSMELPAPRTDLAATPLAGKVIRYGYHTFWEVNKDKGVRGTPAPLVHDLFFYSNGQCEWFAKDIFEGESARSDCGTVEVAPNIYQVTWLEVETRQVVTQVLNLNTWTINSSFHFQSGKGLALFEGDIYSFGDIPKPPFVIPENMPAND